MKPDRRYAAILALAVALIYARTLYYPSLDWDDHIHVFQNPAMRPPTLSSVTGFWTGPYFGFYVPVIYTVWSALAAIGMQPGFYHLLNFGLHWVATLLAFGLLRRWLGERAPVQATFLGALLFAIHPLQVESVAWISGGRDLLAAVLVLLALRVSGNPVRATGAYALALLSKPSAVVFPLLAAAERPRFSRWIALWVGMAGVIVVVTHLIQNRTGMEFVTPIHLRPWIALDALSFYLGKLVLPWNLSVDYGRTPRSVIEGGLWAALPALLGAVALVVAFRKAPFAAGLFVIPLIPVLGIVPFKFQDASTVTDHYAYLAMLGPAYALAWAVRSAERTRWKLHAYRFAAFIIASLALRSAIRVGDWANTVSIFEDTLERNPRSLTIRQALASHHYGEKRYEATIQVLSQGLTIKPDSPHLHHNLAAALAQAGRFEEAIRHYEQAIALRPDELEFQLSLSVAYLQMQRGADALRVVNRVLEREPGNPRALEYRDVAQRMSDAALRK